MLAVRNLIKKFDGLVAVNGVSFTVERNIVLGIIGPNGSGKTTTLNCINGIYKPERGEISLNGEVLTGLLPHEITKRGIGRTFQVPRIFRKMTVLENMLAPVLDAQEDDDKLRSKALELLRYVELFYQKESFGEELSGGQQKLLEFARLLMFEPDLILLDEPFAGVHPVLKAKFYNAILELKAKGKTFILVSHDLTSIYALCSRIVVMNNGEKIAEGTAEEIKENEIVIKAYLGR